MHLMRVLTTRKYAMGLLLSVCLVYFILWRRTQQEHLKFEPLDYNNDENSLLEEHLNRFAFWLSDLKLTNFQVPEGQIKRCPLCIDTNLCTDIANQRIKVDADAGEVRAVYGAWGDRSVLLTNHEKEEVDVAINRYICGTSTDELPVCDVAKEIVSKTSKLLQESSFKPQQLKHTVGTIMGGKPQFRFPVCATTRLVAEMSALSDSDHDGKINAQETLGFWYTAVAHPGVLVSKFLYGGGFESLPPVPEYLGACGQVSVEEAVGSGLGEFLSEGWDFRADLAYQLLDIAHLFLYGDSGWRVVWRSATADMFSLNSNGDVYVSNTSRLVVMESQKESEPPLEVCNWHECLQPYIDGIVTGTRQCDMSDLYSGNLMFLTTCQLLSDSATHRTYVPDTAAQLSGYRGVLHSIPAENRAEIEPLLDECVLESRPGGRMDAAQKLKQYLTQFIERLASDE